MKREHHPYGEFVPRGAKAMIIGSFPIAKFSDPRRRKEILPHEHDFFFGGERNLLWRLLFEIFQMKLTDTADIMQMLTRKKLAVGDVIRSCKRVGGRASDSDLVEIEWNHQLIDVIREYKIKSIFFTSKKVEMWFNRLFPETTDLNKNCLISPSAQSVRSLGRLPEFKKWRKSYPKARAFEFILLQYKKSFDHYSR